jgi:DNA-binding IclR family transcriptional regulator
MEVVATASRVPASTRTLWVLQFLAAQTGPVPAQTIASHVGLPRSSVYDLLTAMAELHFVTHFPEDGRWGLGIGAFEIGSAYLRHDPLERLARPLLSRLVFNLDETAHLSVLHGSNLVYLLKVQPPHPITLISDVGVKLPAHLTASGRAMMAHLSKSQVRALFPSPGSFVKRTSLGPRNLAELRRILSVESRDGYAVERGHITENYTSIASAAFDYLGLPVAAIGVTFRSEVYEEGDLVRMALRVRQAANDLTERLGGTRADRTT